MSAPREHAPRVLCIAGSPRRHGNSETLLDAAVDGVSAAGGVADVLVVVEYDLTPCRGCNSCSKTGHCIVDDRMQELYPRLEAADAIMVASPVYFATVPANLKLLYDRCQPYWARRYVLHEVPREQRRPGAFLVVGGGGDPFGFEAAVATTRSVFAVLDVAYSHQLQIEGPDARGEIVKRPSALAEAERIGTRIVGDVLAQRT